MVGTGSFGVVFQAKCLETGETVRLLLHHQCTIPLLEALELLNQKAALYNDTAYQILSPPKCFGPCPLVIQVAALEMPYFENKKA